MKYTVPWVILGLFLFPNCGNINSSGAQGRIRKGIYLPTEVVWLNPFKDNREKVDLNANFRTLIFSKDTVYIFDCINNLPIKCVDSSVFDKLEKVYVDTVVCKYEDSILFAVENVEEYMGIYQINNANQIICRLRRISESHPEDNATAADSFIDSMRLFKDSSIVYKDRLYRISQKFNQESYRRLNELIEVNLK